MTGQTGGEAGHIAGADGAMRRLCLFGDEAGDMTFAPHGRGITRYFLITTAVFRDHGALQADFQELRHDLAAEGIDRPAGFHASSDPQPIRDRVFDVLAAHEFAIDVTVFEKSKANPLLYASLVDFYRSAWFWHLRRVIPDRCLPAPELLVVAAELRTNATRRAYYEALRTAMTDVEASETAYETAFWPASTDLCIQAADYCGWAVFRKWESGDTRSYRLIEDRVGREYDLFARGTTHYY